MRRRLRRWRLYRPPRTIRPTREGWWFLLAALGIGFAAINTGNNLLYLLLAMLLSVIVVSGMLSEQCLRRLRLTGVAPLEIFAGRPTLVGCLLANAKRFLPSYCLLVEPPARAGGGAPPVFVPKLDPGQERLCGWEVTFPRRGRHRLTGLRVTTRFPFGLFVKASHPVLLQEFLVFPAVLALAAGELQGLAEPGGGTERRPGRGGDLHNLREYRWGDDPRLIHWRSSAKSGALMVRELEAEAALRVRLVLDPPGGPADEERQEAGISRAASLATHLIGREGAVEMSGAGLFVPLGAGPAHLRRILQELALWAPPASGTGLPAPSVPGLREIRIPLGAGAHPRGSSSA